MENYSQESEWLGLDLNERDGKASGLSKSKTTHTKSTNETSLNQKDITMSKTAVNITYPTSMQSLAGFLAKTLASLGAKRVLVPHARVYSTSSHESLGSFDLDTGLWRTSQTSLMELMDSGSLPSSQKWPRSGMMRAGIVFRLPPLTRHTAETESGLLHTPTSTANQDSPSMRSRDKGSWWATPRANKISGKDREDFSLSLHNQVNQFPTPKAHDAKESYSPSQVARNTATLTVVVGMFPTPTATDIRDRENMSLPSVQRRQRIGKQIDLSTSVKPDSTPGFLSADWVEVYLMGLPLGWTSLKNYRAPHKQKKTEPTDLKRSAMD